MSSTSQSSERNSSSAKSNAQSSHRNKGQKGLADLFVHGIKDMYYAEKKIYKALPKMIKAAQSKELSEALSSHRDETQEHISKLEEIFDLLNLPNKGTKCDAIDGILDEAESILEEFGETNAGDAAIIFSGQAVEHYEITRYGSLHAFAKVLKYDEAGELIAGVLNQEKAADSKLSELAEGSIDAAAAEDDDEEDEVQTTTQKAVGLR